LGYVYIVSSDGDRVLAMLDGPPEEQTIEAGVEIVERRLREDGTDWAGSRLPSWSLPLLFNGWPRDDVEEECAAVRRFLRQPARAERPPRLKIRGVAALLDVEWAAVTAEPDVEVTLWRDRRRVRARYNLTVIRHNPIDVAKIKGAKRTRDRFGDKAKRTYRVREGDTLQRIATRELGDPGRAREIRKLNKLRDGKRIKPGQRLKLP